MLKIIENVKYYALSALENRSDKGMYLENVAFRELLKQSGGIDKIKFWRTQDQKEVDFVAGEKAYEIKYNSFGRKEKNKKFLNNNIPK